MRFVWILVALGLLGLGCAPGLEDRAAVAVPDAALNRRWQQAGDAARPGEWSGADGTSSVALPGGRIAWFFSDTFLGPVDPDGRRAAGSPWTHNSLVVQDGDHLTTVASGTPVRPPLGLPGWYWAGAGAVEGGTLVEFYHRFTGSSAWDFTEQSVAIATFALPDLRLVDVRELPAVGSGLGRSPVMWGSALLGAGAWTYIYGYRVHADQPGNPKWLYLARAPSGRLDDPEAWQYDTGQGWSADPAAAAEMPTRVDAGFGALQVGGRFALVTRGPSATLTDNAVMAYLAPAPDGPFRASESSVLFRAPETRTGEYVYEARVHPELGDPDVVIVSYNVNAGCLFPGTLDASVYRPRFVRVPVNLFRPGYRPPPSSPNAAADPRSPPQNPCSGR